MRYYPVLLDLRGRKCVVVGGGKIAQRKAYSLVKAAASVYIISPDLTPRLRELARKKKISYIKSKYRKRFLKDAFVVIAATDNRTVNSKISKSASRLGKLVNVVDSPADGNFIVPASFSNKDLIISVSTSGKAPSLAKKIKQDLSKIILPRYVELLNLLVGNAHSNRRYKL